MTDLIWHQLHWQRPLEVDRVIGVLRHWAADQRSPLLVLETRATATGVAYYLGLPAVAQSATTLLDSLATLVAVEPTDRLPVTVAVKLKASTRHRPLRTTDLEAAARAVLQPLTAVQDDEQLVLQIVLGSRRIPLAIPNQSPSSVVMPWYQVAWQGNGGQVDGEKRAVLRNKVGDHGFACTIRLGVTASSKARRSALVMGVLAGLRTSEAAGVRLKLAPEQAARLNHVRTPLLWPLRLNVNEIAAITGWPLGDDDLPGQPAMHPKRLPPAPGTTGAQRVIAMANAPGLGNSTLALPASAALHHTHVLGPTGTGKTTLLLNLICQDIAAGRAVVVIEPKGDLVADILARIPEHRRQDVVILDASDPNPVGLNPLSSAGRRPEVVADGMLAIFKQLYGRDIGARSQDVLYAALLTLAHHKHSSLVMLPLLLTNAGFRRSMTAGIRDPLTLEPFWASYEQYSEQGRAEVIGPVMNKLRPLIRPGLRNVIGQREPRFDLKQVFTERKILLVPLQRGIIGSEAAALLGSLVLSELWRCIQARVNVPTDKRHPVMVTVDELQDYLATPTDLAEALAQARGMACSFTMAHQFLEQLDPKTENAILNNARSRIGFQLAHADAVTFAKGHSELTPEDFTSLGSHEIYASLYANGKVNPYASGTTLAPAEPFSDVAELRQLSRTRYGRPLDEIEASFAELATAPASADTATGRRRRSAV